MSRTKREDTRTPEQKELDKQRVAKGQKAFLDKKYNELETDVTLHSGFGLNWCTWGVGFGQLYISQNKETGKITIDSECMSKEFIKSVLCAMVDKADLY